MVKFNSSAPRRFRRPPDPPNLLKHFNHETTPAPKKKGKSNFLLLSTSIPSSSGADHVPHPSTWMQLDRWIASLASISSAKKGQKRGNNQCLPSVKYGSRAIEPLATPQLRPASGSDQIKSRDKLPGNEELTRIAYGPIIYLIFAFEDQDVGHPAERNAQVNNFGFSHVIRDVANVDDTRRFSRTSRFQFHLQIKKDRHYKTPEIPLPATHTHTATGQATLKNRENQYFLPALRPPSVFIKLRRRWRDVPSCSGGKALGQKPPQGQVFASASASTSTVPPSAVVSSIYEMSSLDFLVSSPRPRP